MRPSDLIAIILLASACNQQTGAEKLDNRTTLQDLDEIQGELESSASVETINNTVSDPNVEAYWEEIVAFNDAEASSFINVQCAQCHSDGGSGSSFSGIWAFSVDLDLRVQIERDIQVQKIHDSIYARNFGGKLPMPPSSLSEDDKLQSLRFLKWLYQIFPELKAGSVLPAISTTPTPTDIADDEFDWSLVEVPSDSQVEDFFQGKCFSCHGENRYGFKGPFFREWGYDDKSSVISQLEADARVGLVFASLWKKRFGEGVGVGMPPFLINATDFSRIDGVLAWMKAKFSDLSIKKGDSEVEPVKKNTSYQCSNPISQLHFLARFTYAAFDRPPREEERISLLDEGEFASSEATAAFRQTVFDLLKIEENKKEFFEVGLRKLVDAISQSPRLSLNHIYSIQEQQSLKQELFRMVRRHFDDWKYEKYFRENKVMVNEHTALFYGCPQPTAGTWNECPLPSGRVGFFSTRGFLSSIPSTFLTENNNYGRMAAMYFVLHGEDLKPATNGPTGTDARPLPTCFVDKDNRTRNGGPRGTTSVAEHGLVCQSCHLNRYLAAASILFRPFSLSGRFYDPDNSRANLDKDLWQIATDDTWSYKAANNIEQPVTEEWLLSLLEPTLPTCIEELDQPKPINTIQDLAEVLISDKKMLLTGFARHAQRALGESGTITEELLHVFENREGRLDNTIANLVEQYFLSESFACASRP